MTNKSILVNILYNNAGYLLYKNSKILSRFSSSTCEELWKRTCFDLSSL